jgi:m7GpppX diphosphatase
VLKLRLNNCVLTLASKDTRSKLVNILGKIDGQSAIIIAEKTAFNTSPEFLQAFAQPANLSQLSVIENNDIYYWYHASQASGELPQHSEAKLTLIYPATDAHIRKYSVQNLRMVTETPEIYREHVKPYIESKTAHGRLSWVYNILEKKAEAESIIFEDNDPVNGFILSPDL